MVFFVEKYIYIFLFFFQSSNAMGMVSYLLSRNPRVQEKLIKEVDSVLQNRICTAEDLPNLKYAKAIVKETLR
jgi:vitamin D3 24-hydroxylase